MEIEYGNGWHSSKGRFFVGYSYEEAKEMDADKKRYSALVYGKDWENVSVAIDHPKSACEVDFLGEYGESRGRYFFYSLEKGSSKVFFTECGVVLFIR